jgi:hypothetical protein
MVVVGAHLDLQYLMLLDRVLGETIDRLPVLSAEAVGTE